MGRPPPPLPPPVTEAERHERDAALSQSLDRLAAAPERDAAPPPPLGPVEQAIARAVHQITLQRRACRAERRAAALEQDGPRIQATLCDPRRTRRKVRASGFS
jgi:hypothetical protein